MVNDMDYKGTIKKHTIIIALCIIGGALLIAGTSYALFYQVHTNSENQVVRTGKLEVTYGQTSSKITLENLVPMEDEDALANNSYASNLRIENTGSLPASYALKIGKDLDALAEAEGDPTKFVDLDYVRIAVFVNNEQVPVFTDNEDNPIPGSLGSLTAGEDGMYSLYTGTLGVGQNDKSADVVVHLWIDKDIPETEIGNYVYFKMDVNSVVDEANTPEGQVNP